MDEVGSPVKLLVRLAPYWKIVTAFVAIGGLLVGELVLAFQTTLANQSADAAVERTLRIMRVTQDAEAALSNIESGYHGFPLTGIDSFLEPVTEGRAAFRARMDELRRLTAGNAAQQERWRTIETLTRAWEQDSVEPNLQARRGSGSTTLPAQADMQASIVDGQQRVGQVRDVFAEAIGVQESILQQRARARTQSDQVLLNVLVWGTLVAIVLSCGLGAAVLLSLERARLAGVWLAIQTSEHEINNRLASASANLQLLLHDDGLTDGQAKRARNADDSVRSAAGAVRQMRHVRVLRETAWGAGDHRTIDLAG
jgi:CHASE3 domain sensor protein